MSTTQPSLAALETLMGAYDTHLRAGDFLSCTDPRAWIAKSNILLDACLDCGMSHDEADHHVWAAARVTKFLCEA
jgi:hypothetical protein